MMVELNEMRVLKVLANTTNTNETGEVMQLINVHDPNIDEETYLQVIYRKTACLFEASGHTSAILAAASKKHQEGMTEYGKQLGIAFQLIDDVLDYSSSAEVLGKNLGDDLAEGKPTLPITMQLKIGVISKKILFKQQSKMEIYQN